MKGPGAGRGEAGRGGAEPPRRGGHRATMQDWPGGGHASSPGKGAWSRGRPLCHRGLLHPLPGAHLPRLPRGSRWGRTRASLGTLGSFPFAFCASGNRAPAFTSFGGRGAGTSRGVSCPGWATYRDWAEPRNWGTMGINWWVCGR